MCLQAAFHESGSYPANVKKLGRKKKRRKDAKLYISFNHPIHFLQANLKEVALLSQ